MYSDAAGLAVKRLSVKQLPACARLQHSPTLHLAWQTRVSFDLFRSPTYLSMRGDQKVLQLHTLVNKMVKINC